MSNRVVRLSSKSDAAQTTTQKMLPLKAIHLFEPIGSAGVLKPGLPFSFGTPKKFVSGHRSPGAITSLSYRVKSGPEMACMRRTASLDMLHTKHSCTQPVCSTTTTFINVDKATQTDESFVEKLKGVGSSGCHLLASPINNDFKMEKVIRQRIQRNSFRTAENSVSSQTLSPVHARASPMLIPSPRTSLSCHMKPMRNSVEGLNQEIEKLVLYSMTSGGHSSECDLMTKYTPDHHRSHYCDLFNANTCASADYSFPSVDSRSVNTQTPVFDRRTQSDDDSHSTSPDDEAAAYNIGASPRINRFLAREPPDGCEKINLKVIEQGESIAGAEHLEKPKLFGGFQLRPSLGSAFMPLQPYDRVDDTLAPSTKDDTQ